MLTGAAAPTLQSCSWRLTAVHGQAPQQGRTNRPSRSSSSSHDAAFVDGSAVAAPRVDAIDSSSSASIIFSTNAAGRSSVPRSPASSTSRTQHDFGQREAPRGRDQRPSRRSRRLSDVQGRSRVRVATGFRSRTVRPRLSRALCLHRGDSRHRSGPSSSGPTAATRSWLAEGSYSGLSQQIDERGTVDVLRHGVRDQNVEIRLSYCKPAFGVAPELVAHYDANRLTVTRQLPYEAESNKTVDLLPVRQRHPGRDGRAQEPPDRPEHRARHRAVPHGPRPEERHARTPALVHFAVDPDSVAMTTRLDGKATRFLPFNLGHNLGKGNPPNPAGHKTVLPVGAGLAEGRRGSTSSHRFVHVERPRRGRSQRRRAETVIFPRYHQWDAVLELEADAAPNGAGAVVPRPALRWLRQVEHDRLDSPTGSRRCTTARTARSSTRSSSSPTA